MTIGSNMTATMTDANGHDHLLDNHQASELGVMAQTLLQSLDEVIGPWLALHGFPADDRYRMAGMLTILDAFAFMMIAEEVEPEARQEAARLHSRTLRHQLRKYHADTGR